MDNGPQAADSFPAVSRYGPWDWAYKMSARAVFRQQEHISLEASKADDTMPIAAVPL